MIGRHPISLALYLSSIVTLPLATSQAAPLSTSEPAATPAAESKSGSDADPVLVDRERQLMEKGYVLRQQSKDADALAVYREAYALRHDAKPLAEMALALEALGNWSQAYAILQQVLAVRSHPWIESNRAILDSELVRIGQHLGRVALVVQPEGATVRINGSAVGTAPLERPLLLNTGWSTVEVALTGYAPYRHELEIQAGKEYSEVVRLTRLSLAPGTKEGRPMGVVGPTHPSRNVKLSRHNPLWLGTALGGLLVATAAVIPWSSANDKVDRLAQECKNNQKCPFGETSDDVRRLDRISNTLLITGFGIAVTSTVLYLTLPKAAPQGGIGVAAWASSCGVTISYSGLY